MVEAIQEFFTKYADFNGRTTRKNYWMVVLALFLVSFAISFFFGMLSFITGLDFFSRIASGISGLISLATLVPSIAIATRRLHDTNKSGWYQLIAFVPCVGVFILIFFLASPAVDQDNHY